MLQNILGCKVTWRNGYNSLWRLIYSSQRITSLAVMNDTLHSAAVNRNCSLPYSSCNYKRWFSLFVSFYLCQKVKIHIKIHNHLSSILFLSSQMPLPFLAITLSPRYCGVRDSAFNITTKMACRGAI